MRLFSKFFRAGVIILLILIALVIPELLARRFIPAWDPTEYVFFVGNPETGWSHPPSTQLVYRDTVFNTNHLGIRSAEISKKQKPRILFLGDSFTWGWGVQDSERFSRHLQDRLVNYELINSGITGYGTLQEYFFLTSTFNEIQPDAVVLQMYKNDFYDNVTPGGPFPHPYFDWKNNFNLVNHPVPEKAIGEKVLNYFSHETYFYRQIFIKLYMLLMVLPIDLSNKTTEPERQHEIEGMHRALTMLFSFCQEKKLPILVFSYGMDAEQFTAIQSVSNQFKISAHELEPAFQEATERTDLGDPHAHWNAYGNERIADYMLPFILNKK